MAIPDVGYPPVGEQPAEDTVSQPAEVVLKIGMSL